MLLGLINLESSAQLGTKGSCAGFFNHTNWKQQEAKDLDLQEQYFKHTLTLAHTHQKRYPCENTHTHAHLQAHVHQLNHPFAHTVTHAHTNYRKPNLKARAAQKKKTFSEKKDFLRFPFSDAFKRKKTESTLVSESSALLFQFVKQDNLFNCFSWIFWA